MSILLFGVSSTSVLLKPRTNSDSNDGHTPPPPLNSPRATPRLVSGHHPPPLACSPGTAEQGEGSQPVRQACSPHQLRESTRQACILTSLAATNPGGLQSSLEDFRNRGERSHGEGGVGVGAERASSCRNDAAFQIVAALMFASAFTLVSMKH